jgi:hypothetical protein
MNSPHRRHDEASGVKSGCLATQAWTLEKVAGEVVTDLGGDL